ncbi:MAG: AAA family ATPase [Chloroflexi bacterium]|nr:AAA family ATPase [Chloroflexota bacterium]
MALSLGGRGTFVGRESQLAGLMERLGTEGRREGGASTAPGLFVGRELELGRLHGAWGRALLGERYVALVSGEPGIGKTRVAFEFAREVTRGGALNLYGRCFEDAVVPYEPFVQMLRQLATGPEPESVVVESARAMLVDLVPALSGAPSPADSPTRRLVLFEGVRSLLREAARTCPLLLVIEDLHWADADTVRLLRYLGRGTWGVPALVLGTFRDTEPHPAVQPLHAAIADLHGEGILDQIELGPLAASEVAAFAEQSLGHEISALEARRIHEASGGNPFFVQELVALLDAEGETGTAYPVPVAAREVIANRLSGLSPGCREVLARASILGGEAEVALLRALWDGDGATLAAGLGEAVSARLLLEEETHYRFFHALVQQAVYLALPLPDRQQLHLRAARAIETRQARREAEGPIALATHYRKAGDTAAPAEALPHALAAAEAALAAFALDDAIAWWEWALSLMEALGTDPPTRARLLERMAGVLDVAREQPRATGYLQRALRLHEESGDPVAIGRSRSRLGRSHANGNLRSTDLATARVHFEAAELLLKEASDNRGIALLYGGWAMMGISAFRVGDLRHAEAARQLNAELGSVVRDPIRPIALGMLAFHLGDLDPSFRSHEEARQEARARGDVSQSGLAAWMIAIQAQRLCDPRVAVESLRPELEDWPAPAAAVPWGIASRLVSALADAGDLPAMQALAREHTARDEGRIEVMIERSAFAFFAGDWDGPAWAEAEAAALTARRREDRCSSQNLGHWLVRAYHARGESERAAAFLTEELSAVVAGGSLAQELVARAELAVLQAEAGAASEASAHVSRCRELFAGPAARRGLEGKVLLAEALLAARLKGPDAATALFEQAIDIFRRYSTPWLEARAFEDWSGVLRNARRRAQAASLRRQAEASYRRIGAGQPWLDRLATLAGPNGSRPNGPGIPDGLTTREAEILRLIADGRSSREIGEMLVLSVRTVERHIANIYLKTGTHGRVEAASYAHARGLVPAK